MQVIEIKGAIGKAFIYATNNTETALDGYARAQLQLLCDNEASRDAKIRVMPDVHPAKVCTVGLTMMKAGNIVWNTSAAAAKADRMSTRLKPVCALLIFGQERL